MSKPFQKRGKWWARKEDGETKRFATLEEANAFLGVEEDAKPRISLADIKRERQEKQSAEKEKSDEKKDGKEEASTYKQKTVFFGKSYGEKEV